MTGAKQIIVGGLVAAGLFLPTTGGAQTVDEPTASEQPTTDQDPTTRSVESADDEKEQPSAAPSPEMRKKVATLLDGIESSPTAEQWRALGDEAVAVLVEVTADNTLPVVRRGRAVTALAHFDTPDSRQAVTRLVTEADTPRHVRRKAVRTLARIAGDEALPALEPHLGSKSTRLREATIDAVGEIRTSAAKELLRGRIATEPQRYLKKKIAEYLAMPSRTTKSLAPLADVPTNVEHQESEQ
jgi:HEAT repeat protein